MWKFCNDGVFGIPEFSCWFWKQKLAVTVVKNTVFMAFLGTTSLILMAIIIVLAMSLFAICRNRKGYKICQKKLKNKNDMEFFENIQQLFKYLAIIVFLLTISCMFGLIWLIENRQIYKSIAALLFSTANCLFGFIILLGYVLFNKQVNNLYKYRRVAVPFIFREGLVKGNTHSI